MKKPSENALIEELKKRVNENKKALHDLRVLTRKLEQLNRKLQESEATKSNFLSNIRNEIVNPLTSIMGISEQMLSAAMEAGEVQSLSHMVYTEAFNLDFQLKNIFIAAELEAGESVVSVSNVDVTTLTRSLIDSFRHQYEVKGLKVEFDCEHPDGPGKDFIFKTDPEKLQVILANLLANAIEYSLAGKKVMLKAWRKDDMLNISVEDEGKGIAIDEKEEIFDRFKQLDSGFTKSHRGHGLGLSVTKGLMDLMSGDIDFSAIAGKGSIFNVSIPESSAMMEVDIFSEDGNEFIFESEEEF